MRDTGPSIGVRQAVHTRSGGVCERCRRATAVDVHHRRARGMGGSSWPGINKITNLVDLCRPCHEWTEGHLSDAEATGWKIRLGSTIDPGTVPLRPVVGPAWLPAEDGGRWEHVAVDDVRHWF